MKKIYLILMFMLIVMFVFTISVLAASTELKFEGTKKVEPGSTNEISLKISSSNTVGIVSGKFEFDSKLSNLKLEGRNGWNLTYNEETGDFNIYKASGSKEEEIMKIEFKAGSSEGSAKIKLKDLKCADVEYNEVQLEDVVETITISKTQSEKNETDKQNQTGNNTTNNTSKNNTSSENTSKNNTTNSNISDRNNTNTSNNNISNESSKDKIADNNSNKVKEDNKITPKVENSQVEQKALPYTGLISVVIPMGIVILAIGSIAAYFGYKKYRGI